MARIEGTQNIPSEWKYAYDGTLTPLMPNSVIRSRYPWHVTQVQEGGPKESGGHKKQRARWKAIRDKFNALPWEERQRWYAARPPWASLLWYYNYFMLSGLMGNALVGDKGGGVIKSIQHKTFTLPGGAPTNVTVNIDAIDPAKGICFFYGGGGYLHEWDGQGAVVPNYPYLVSLASSYLIAKASMYNLGEAGCSVSIIEYL